jgi:elongation factor P hydroxylase
MRISIISQEQASEFWLVCDSLSDVIFVFDVVVQLRTGYLEQGLMVRMPTMIDALLNYLSTSVRYEIALSFSLTSTGLQ